MSEIPKSSHFNTSNNTCKNKLIALWELLKKQASQCDDPLICDLLTTAIHSHQDFSHALTALLARKLGDQSISIKDLYALIDRCHNADRDIVCAAAADLLAIYERDAACPDILTPFLFFKGYHAIQGWRVAHWLWHHERKLLALHLQSRISELFAVDIHPAARIGRRVFLDHGTAIVIGETCVIDDDVSLLQDVTLGGTGKHCGDRHPKVRRGVMIGSGAKVLGNIEIGEGAKIGAGSIVLEAVPPHTTVVGNPARRVGMKNRGLPALDMDQTLPPPDYMI